MNNQDDQTVAQFSAMAAQWWDPNGPCRPLHDLNLARLQFILEHQSLAGKQVLDVGCGGGILTESLAREGAHTVGIDASGALIEVARSHADALDLSIDYQETSVEAFALNQAGAFDVVVCFELLEHVPDPAAFVQTLATLVRPQGAIFFSTLNRTAAAFFKAIVGAEYVLNLLPKGTHHYQEFIRPSELVRWSTAAGLQACDLRGLHYDPWRRQARLCTDVSVNYLLYTQQTGSPL
jgi:2-polyprenyl-6-hydroxyphenyl methylase / 3-demethylubiquinone-9 3-methyltransferase